MRATAGFMEFPLDVVPRAQRDAPIFGYRQSERNNHTNVTQATG